MCRWFDSGLGHQYFTGFVLIECSLLKIGQTVVKPVTAKHSPERLTPYEAAVKVGLLGCIEGPPDLALNHRKYARRALRAKYRRAKRAP